MAVDLGAVADEDTPRVVATNSVPYVEGREDVFRLVDLMALRRYTGRFELRLVTPHAYWYFELGESFRQEDIEKRAAVFEEEIYPRVTSVFGREWVPGVDGDPRLTIVNGRLRGVGGYYSSADEYPLVVNEFSNQREMIYINSEFLKLGEASYSAVLAHELQHAVHWNADPSEDQWVSEGLSELAVTVAGFERGGVRNVGPRPISLVNWPLGLGGVGAHYQLASLFMHYLLEHYGDPQDLRPLLNEPRDGVAGITDYLTASGYGQDFRDVFRDWAVANLLDEDQGPYGYSGLEVQTDIAKEITGFSEFTSQIPQYSIEYVDLSSFKEPIVLKFHGPSEIRLLPVEVGPRGCWWGNSGDSINSTMTRTVSLAGLDRATLTYQVWFNLEEGWDYAYLEVSPDDGRTWEILGTPNTTSENLIGNSYGMGYTGDSRGWLNETVDLSSYAGQRILLRFQYITDDAVHGSGICVRAIAVPGAVTVDLMDEWQTDGFLLTGNRVKQEYAVQVIEIGAENRVSPVMLDQANTGELIVAGSQDRDRLVVAVAPLAPKTREEASYTLTVAPAGGRTKAPASANR